MKRRNQAKEMQHLNQEHRAILRGKKAKKMQKEDMSDGEDDDEDTEQL